MDDWNYSHRWYSSTSLRRSASLRWKNNVNRIERWHREWISLPSAINYDRRNSNTSPMVVRANVERESMAEDCSTATRTDVADREQRYTSITGSGSVLIVMRRIFALDCWSSSSSSPSSNLRFRRPWLIMFWMNCRSFWIGGMKTMDTAETEMKGQPWTKRTLTVIIASMRIVLIDLLGFVLFFFFVIVQLQLKKVTSDTFAHTISKFQSLGCSRTFLHFRRLFHRFLKRLEIGERDVHIVLTCFVLQENLQLRRLSSIVVRWRIYLRGF